MADLPDRSVILPVARRATWVWLCATTLCAALALAWILLRRPLGLPHAGVWRWLPLAMIASPFVIGVPLWYWRVRRLRRALFAARFRLCTHCAYDLSPMPPTGNCPECGHPYDAARDVLRWEQTGFPYAEPRPRGFVPWSAEPSAPRPTRAAEERREPPAPSAS